MIVRADVARTQRAQHKEAIAGEADAPVTDDGARPVPEDRQPAAQPAPKERPYFGSVQIDPHRVNREIGVIVEEIIERLVADPSASVEIRLEISASNLDGFDEGTVRTIKENSRTLRFDTFDFEVD